MVTSARVFDLFETAQMICNAIPSCLQSSNPVAGFLTCTLATDSCVWNPLRCNNSPSNFVYQIILFLKYFAGVFWSSGLSFRRQPLLLQVSRRQRHLRSDPWVARTDMCAHNRSRSHLLTTLEQVLRKWRLQVSTAPLPTRSTLTFVSSWHFRTRYSTYIQDCDFIHSAAICSPYKCRNAMKSTKKFISHPISPLLAECKRLRVFSDIMGTMMMGNCSCSKHPPEEESTCQEARWRLHGDSTCRSTDAWVNCIMLV